MTDPLGKPPIVEAWIAFKFEPAPDAIGWDAGIGVVKQFFEDLSPKYSDLEYVCRESFIVEKRTPQGIPTSGKAERQIVSFRALTEDKTRAVQIAPDVLSYHLLRAGDSYPGFSRLRDDSLGILDRYAERFRPRRITQIELHMIDMVTIPVQANEKCQVEDYFAISLNMPTEPFGSLSDFSIRLQLNGSAPNDVLHLDFRLIRAGSSDGEYRFRIKWDMACPVQFMLTERESVLGRLDDAYRHLFNCFKSMFTKRGWDLFEPPSTSPSCS